MSEYSVEFRIICDVRSSASVVSEMELTASTLIYSDDKFVWGYNGTDKLDEPIYWNDLEAGIDFVMQRLLHRLHVIQRLSKEEHYECVWWCGQFVRGVNGSSSLSSGCLAKLADFGVDFYLDSYFARSISDDSL